MAAEAVARSRDTHPQWQLDNLTDVQSSIKARGRRLATMLGLLAILVAPGFALADNACQFHGSWFGHLPSSDIDILFTAHGVSSSKGIVTLELPGFDPTLGGLFGDAVKISTARGTWQRIDNQPVALTVPWSQSENPSIGVTIRGLGACREVRYD